MTVRLFLTCAAALSAAAAPVSTERLRENETRQGQLQSDARGIASSLGAMLDEYSRNGLAGEDVEILRKLRDSLDHLSTEEMKSVIDLLQVARAATDEGAAKKSVADAYAQQKGILTQMARLIAEHGRAQEALELSQAAVRLADRQAANLQNGIDLGKWSGGKKPEDFEKAMQANLEGQRTEQAAIAEDLRALGAKIADFAKQAPDTTLAERFQKGADDLTGSTEQATRASDALKAGQLFSAVTREKATRDALRKIARQIAPPQNDTETLRAAERELSRMIAEQQKIATDAAQAGSDFDRWLAAMAKENAADPAWQRPPAQLRADAALRAKFDETRKQQLENLPALENAQGDLSNKTDLLAQDLASAAPTAAEGIRAAQQQMQEARAALTEQMAPDAARATAAAQAALEKARADIVAQAAEAQAAASGDRARDLQAMRDAAAKLAQQQAARPNAAQQAALAQQAQALARRAAMANAAAAPALQQAAAAARATGQAPAQQMPAAQQAAAQQLAQAAQQLGQQAAAMQQARQQLAQAQRATEELGKIIRSEQKLSLDTKTAHAQFTPGKDQLFAGLDTRQRAIRQDTETFREQTAGPAPRESLHDASQDMRRAVTALELSKGEVAVEAENTSLEYLYRALSVLDQRIQQLRKELNEPNPDDANAQATAAAQIAQAQAALAAAQQALQANQPTLAAQQAAAAAQQAGQVAAQSGLPQTAQQAVQQGAQQAANASAQATAGQTQAAQQSITAAQQSLAQAQTAINAAQSGIASSSPSSGQTGKTAAQSDQSGDPQQVDRAVRALASDSSAFAKLPPRARAAIQQSRSEKYPEEFAPLVEQYLRNLANESASK